MNKFGIPIQYKIIIIVSIILFFIIVYFVGGGSKTFKLFQPQGSVSNADEEEELLDIDYNDKFLEEMSGGYTGAPKLVQSDDKVFYIPPEYCDGRYLRNFRVIGVNQSKAEEKTVVKGDETVTEYNGAVVVYGFQTTYREDYGPDYNFDYEPYEYTMEYDTSDSYFENMMKDATNFAKGEDVITINDYDEKYSADSDITIDPDDIKTEKDPKAVDDSDFRVATVVMEHEIGKDYCKILYCDADSAKVSDLGIGNYNLVTNLNDSALTVCYNNKMYVYNFDEDEHSYGSKERYSYSLDEFFNSITYKNVMQGAGYSSANFDVKMTISYWDCSKGWVNNYLKNMNTQYSQDFEYSKNIYEYFSNIKGDTVKKSVIKNFFFDTRQEVDNRVKAAYNGYKKTFSGWASTANFSRVDDRNFGDFKFTKNSGNMSWELENEFTYTISERSLWIFNGTAKGKVTLSITPKYSLNTKYDYTINDLILTQNPEYYNWKDTAGILYGQGKLSKNEYDIINLDLLMDLDTLHKRGLISESSYELINNTKVAKKMNYAIIMQMLVTPKSAQADDTVVGMDPSEFKKVVGSYPSKFAQYYNDKSREKLESLMEGEDEPEDEGDIEDQLEKMEDEDIDDPELENEFTKELSDQIEKYLTFNIDLSDETDSVSSTDNVYSITGANEAKEQFDAAKDTFNKEYNINIESLAHTVKTGPYAEAGKENAEGLERVKTDFAKIRDKQLEIDAANEKLAEMNEEFNALWEKHLGNAERINATAAEIMGGEIDAERDELGFSKSVGAILDPTKYGIEPNKVIGEYEDFIAAHNTYRELCSNGSDIFDNYMSRLYHIGENSISNYMNGSKDTGNIMSSMIGRNYRDILFNVRRGRAYEWYKFNVYKLGFDDNYDFVLTDSYDTYFFRYFDYSAEDFERAVNDFYNFDFTLLKKEVPDAERKAAYNSLTDILNTLKKYYEFARNLYRFDTDRYAFLTEILRRSDAPYYPYGPVEEYYSELSTRYGKLFTKGIDYNNEVDNSSAATYDYRKYPNDTISRYISYILFLNEIVVHGDNYSVDIVKVDDTTENMVFYDALESSVAVLEEYDEMQEAINEQKAYIEKLNSELKELENLFDNTRYYAHLQWQNKPLNGAELAKNYKNYDTITAEIDKYISAYKILDPVNAYRGDPDKFIQYANELNDAIKDSDVYAYIDHGFNEETFAEKYGKDILNSYMFLEQHGNSLYKDTAIGVYLKNTDDILQQDEGTQTDYNTQMIDQTVAHMYGGRGKLSIEKQSYDDYLKDCEELYKKLYPSFKKVTVTDDDGNDKEVCDITVENVQNAVFTYIIDHFGIYELNNYDKNGDVSGTYTIEKNEQSGGVMEENIESSTETTTEAVYSNSFDAITENYGAIAGYTSELRNCYNNIFAIACDFLKGTGCLTEDQQQAHTPEAVGAESDITSLYYKGYQVPSQKLEEMAVLLDNIEKLYNEREKAADIVRAAEENGLNVTIANNEYYLDLYQKKCSQADDLYRLIYSAAKAGDAEKQKYIEEFQNRDWLILDAVNVAEDLSSVLKVETKKITTYYKNIIWNTALITNDKNSNITDAPYDLYQMDSQFCVGVADNSGFIIPIGAQKDVNVKSLNAEIKKQVSRVGELNNVAYGSEGDVDYLLFSGDKYWYRVAISTRKKSVDINNISGYFGSFQCDTGDPHFMEFDRTRITGVNQLYMSSLDKGYIPYDITLKNNDASTITEVEDPFAWENTEILGDENTSKGTLSGSKGIRGAYFNAWSDSKGNVVLLGFSEDDMRIETTSESETETTTSADIVFNFEDPSETTTEARREISDDDIYDAHLYVYKFATKKAELPEKYDDPLANWKGPDVSLFDAGIRLEGHYGRLLQPAVNFFTLLRDGIIGIVYALAALYAVFLGVKLSRADDDEKRHEAKEHIKWFVLAVFIAHVLIAFIYLGQKQLTEWEGSVTSNITTETTAEAESTTETDDSDKITLK